MSSAMIDALKAEAIYPSQSDNRATHDAPESQDAARNGMPFREMALSGIRVFSAIMRGYSAPLDDERWFYAAKQATRMIEDSLRTKADVPWPVIASYIASWTDPGVAFEVREERERLAFVVIAKHFTNLVINETAPDVASVESYALKSGLEWVESKLPKPQVNGHDHIANGHANGHVNGKAKIQVNGSEAAAASPAAIEVRQQPSQRVLPQIGGVVSRMIDLRIAEMEQDIESLREFKAKLGPNDDAALWRLFGPVLSKESHE